MIGALLSLALFTTPQQPPAEKPLAVMIHGAGGGGWEYDFWKPIFEKAGWEVKAHDLVPVEEGLAETRFSDYVGQVKEQAQDRRPVVLIGASMGGILALKAAETIRPNAIILINSVAPAAIPQERPSRQVPDIIPWANGPLQETRDAMPDSDEKTILWAHKKWRDESGAVLREIYRGIQAPAPTCPVLVIIGESDTDIKPEISLATAAWSNADIHFYHGMSHVGPLLSTRANEVASAALQWVDSRVKPTPASGGGAQG